MVINNVLDEVFSTWSNIAVLRALKDFNIGISGREIARLSDMSAKSCLSTLSALESLGIVDRVRGGRDHLFSLNRNHFLVKEIILPVLYSEKKFISSLFTDIKKKLSKYSESIILFGSTARKNETVESDLDICIVYKNIKLKREIEKITSGLNSVLKKKYGVSFAPFYISQAEFSERVIKKKSPIPEIIREGKLISGKTFKELVNG